MQSRDFIAKKRHLKIVNDVVVGRQLASNHIFQVLLNFQ